MTLNHGSHTLMEIVGETLEMIDQISKNVWRCCQVELSYRGQNEVKLMINYTLTV